MTARKMPANVVAIIDRATSLLRTEQLERFGKATITEKDFAIFFAVASGNVPPRDLQAVLDALGFAEEDNGFDQPEAWAKIGISEADYGTLNEFFF